jgi:hypothetical protein
VKPARPPGANDPRRVRVPLVKTAAGDLDYVVRLQYGGVMPPLHGIGHAEFPLVHTVNVRVELSQVRLYLPETYRFRFGGTMRQVAGEEELLAGWREYQAKKAEDLRQTLRQKEPFAQVRAASSLKSLKGQAAQIEAGKSLRPSGRELERLFQEADRDILQVEQSLQAGAAIDNRARLGEQFWRQKTARARNTLQELGANFEVQLEPQTTAAGPSEAGFNPKWLDKSQLVNAAPLGKSAGAPSVEEKSQSRVRLDLFARGESASGKPAAGNDLAQRGPGISRSKAVPPMAALPGGGGPASQPVAQQARGLVGRYQEKLEEQPGQAGQFGRRVPPDGGFLPPMAASPALPAAGLASLDVEFPVHGAAYLFTTPQGDTQITAWAVSTTLLASVVWVFASIVAAGLVLGITRHLTRAAE